MSVKWVRICPLTLTLLGLCVLSLPALAEGGCPPGMYPIGGQGVQGCAPIPGAQGGAGSGSSSSPALPPRPTGEWIKTWGALAGAIDGTEGGASENQLTEDAARSKAIENCQQQGGGSCKVDFVYQNQCVSAVNSELVSTGTKYASSGTVASATKLAVQECKKAGGKDCRSIYSACAIPFFRAY